MIAVDIVCVGKIKEKYLSDGIAEYAKRLSRFCKFTVTELAEEYSAARSEGEIRQVKEKEGERISDSLDGYVIALCIDGRQMDSEEFARRIAEIPSRGESKITFVIGGSYGLSDKVINKADMKLSFGSFTYPHQLMRLILTEQIYRAFMINGGGTYHK